MLPSFRLFSHLLDVISVGEAIWYHGVMYYSLTRGLWVPYIGHLPRSPRTTIPQVTFHVREKLIYSHVSHNHFGLFSCIVKPISK